MTQLIVYAGPNGSGKSSLRDILPDTTEVLIDPDRLAREIDPANPRSVDLAAGKRAIRLFNETIAARRSLSLETTLTGRTILQRMKAAQDAGYKLTLVYVTLANAELNVKRVAQRVKKGGHGIDPETIRRRVEESHANFPAAVELCNVAIVLDNSRSSHRLLLEVRDRIVVFEVAKLPAWLGSCLPALKTRLAAVGPED